MDDLRAPSPNSVILPSWTIGAVVAVPGGADGSGSPSAVEVLVLDTVTGRLLYRVRHASASGPVQSLPSASWPRVSPTFTHSGAEEGSRASFSERPFNHASGSC